MSSLNSKRGGGFSKSKSTNNVGKFGNFSSFGGKRKMENGVNQIPRLTAGKVKKKKK